jgi:hypothetical protein
MSNTIGKNMMIITSSFRNVKSFTLIPATSDCPYVEAMYDPSSGILAVISKVMKQSYHMIPKLDDNGEHVRLKAPNKNTGKTVKEERRLVDTFSEFYISDAKDIETFIHLFSINADTFDYKQYIVDTKEPVKKSNIITSV